MSASRSPRALLVSAEYAPTPGGVGDYTARLAGALTAAGACTAILTGTPNAGQVPALEPPGAPLVWRQSAGWGWGLWRTVARAVAAWPAEIVHLQYQTGAYRMHPAINLLPWWLRRQRRRPLVVTTFHDLRAPYLFPRAGRLRPAVNAALAGGSDLAIATNVVDAVELATSARRLALIPIGPNIEPDPTTDAVAARLRADLQLAPHELLLVTFGLLNHSKGLPTLLRALARLNDAAAVGRYRLALVGAGDAGLDPTDRATGQDLRALAAELGLGEALVWVGQRPAAEVAGWLRAADAVALPYVDGASYRRGSLLAALACGAAIVTTSPAASPPPPPGLAAPPPPRGGVHLTLVPPEDPRALATALAATAGDPGLNRALRRGALDLAAHFTWPAIAAHTLDAYARLDQPR